MNRILIYNIFILLLVFIFAVQCTQKSPEPNQMDILFVETLQIGSNEEDAPDHEIFRMVTHSVSDQRGWVYVMNAGETSIRVYDENGEYQFSFGSQGSGPGEFQTVSSFFIDSQNRLLIVDPSQARVTAFSLTGDFLNTYELPSITRVNQILELADGQFVLVGLHNNQLVHITDTDFKELKDGFVEIENILTTEGTKERILLQFSPGFVTVRPDQSIVFVPSLYKGELLVYRADSEGTWKLSETIKGHTTHSEPASITPMDQAARVDVPMVFPEEGRYAVQYHSFSQGVYQLDDRNLVHFSYQESEEDSLMLMTEVFNVDGDLLGTSMINQVNRINLIVLNLDKRGNLYISDNRDYPVLSRLKMQFHSN